MIIRFLTALLFLLSSCIAFADDEPIMIALDTNNGAIVRMTEDGAGVDSVDGKVLEPPSLWVRYVAKQWTNGKYDWAVNDKVALVHKTAGTPEPDPVKSGELQISFRQIGNSDQRLLIIANGYDQALSYRAHILVKGSDRYTDVCTILPGKHGFEHWPYAIDRIVLSDIKLIEWQEDRAPVCE